MISTHSNVRRATNKTDVDLCDDVIGELAWDQRVNAKQIAVQAMDGVVTLAGSVDTLPASRCDRGCLSCRAACASVTRSRPKPALPRRATLASARRSHAIPAAPRPGGLDQEPTGPKRAHLKVLSSRGRADCNQRQVDVGVNMGCST